MAVPKIKITGSMMAPNGVCEEGKITITLVTNKGAASVADGTVPTTNYKLFKKPIIAKILANGSVKNEAGTGDLELVPNTLITPSNTHYMVVYQFKTFSWTEYWQLANADVEIGDITPMGVVTP